MERMNRLIVPGPIHERLKAWSRWCRSAMRLETVRCQSIEARYLPAAGDVYEGIETVLAQARPSVPEWPSIQIEVRVMRLPRQARTVLRLSYVWRSTVPFAQALRIAGLGERDYDRVRYDAAMRVCLQDIDKAGNMAENHLIC